MDKQETPPRAWGRLLPSPVEPTRTRNTPTGVGKTAVGTTVLCCRWKHPHGRGEDGRTILNWHWPVETPPRAWGRPRMVVKPSVFARNTPTGVGKTSSAALDRLARQKHPHGRGEDAQIQPLSAKSMETPPRAWGRRIPLMLIVSRARNTPTGVGKTRPSPYQALLQWKHPHGRGEDQLCTIELNHPEETPPRAWGRPQPTLKNAFFEGNTPTGVGKTSSSKM